MKTILAIATIIGTVAGAGILGLPYAISISGFIPGVILMIILSFCMTLLMLYLGEVVLRCKEVYQLPGLVRKYLGNKMSLFTLILFALSIYGALISYIGASSTALSPITQLTPQALMIIFTLAMAYPVIKGTRILDKTQLILMAIKLTLIITISILIMPGFKIENVTSINLNRVFYPFGVIFFALTGYSIIPELEKVLIKEKKLFQKSVILAMIIATVLYVFFTLIFTGVYGTSVNQVATESVTNALKPLHIAIVIFSMITPFIGLSIALNNAFIQDLKTDKWTAALLTLAIPLLINLLFQPSFITPIQITGTYSGALTGFIIVKLWLKARKTKGGDKPEYTAPLGRSGAVIVTIALSLGVVMTTLELLNLL